MTGPSNTRNFLSAALTACAIAACGARGGEITPLTRVREIRALSRVEAAKALPVHVRGVVTWQSANPNGSFVVDDGDRGIYVDLFMSIERRIWKSGDIQRTETEAGAVLEIEGVTDPGGYAPIIRPIKIRRVGSGSLPPPRRVPNVRLLSGNEDAQRVEVEGVVHSVTRVNEADVTAVGMVVDGNPCRVMFEYGNELNATSLIDARVKIRGVLTPLFNLRSQVAGMKISSGGAADIEVLVPARADPFLAPRVTLDNLLPFSPDREPYHRTVTSGIVTFAKLGEFFFLQDGKTGIRVQSTDLSVRVGERMEVAGFVETTHSLASLGNAVTHSLGPGHRLAPEPVTAREILSPNFLQNIQPAAAVEDFSGRLVRSDGKLIRVERDLMNHPTKLLIESGGQTFTALPPRPNPEELPPGPASWQEGALLSLTGVCELDFAPGVSSDNASSITGFRLWLRSPLDVRVLSQPSWWTPFRLRLALLGAGCLIVLGLAWIGLLRRLLRRRTARFEEVMRSHRDVELEFSAVQRERLRLAVDLHDGIKQHLATTSFRLDAAAGNLPACPEIAAGHLEVACNTLIRTQTELEECLWGLHAVAEGPPDFVNLLRHVTSRAVQWPTDSVLIESEGTPRPFPRDVAGSLLLLFQEAAGNAFRHGSATLVTVRVTYGPEALDLRIEDDGSGFDPATAPGPNKGHFGIEGMRKRMKWLHGTLHIHRHPSGGVEVHARFPWTREILGTPRETITSGQTT